MKEANKRSLMVGLMIFNSAFILTYLLAEPAISGWAPAINWLAFVILAVQYKKSMAYRQGWIDAAKRMHDLNRPDNEEVSGDRFSPTCRDIANHILVESKHL